MPTKPERDPREDGSAPGAPTLCRILVVDDKEENLYYLQALLTGLGHAVVTAKNGAEAMERAREKTPDLAISDILMPVMDGFTLCRVWMQDERLKRVPFIFYTATYTEPKDEELGLRLGATRFIVKPVEPDAFARIVEDVLAEHARGQLRVPEQQAVPEPQYMSSYNQVLIHKLEDKLKQLEEANRALAAKDAFNRAVLDSIASLVAVVDDRGTVQAVNNTWVQFAADAPPLSFLRLAPTLDVYELLRDDARSSEASRRLLAGLARVLDHQVREFDLELPYPRGGETRWFLVRVEAMDSAGAVIACVNITERKRSEEAAVEMSRRKDQFLGLLGHELRNPLAPIKTASYLLRKLHLGDQTAERACEIIDRQTAHLGKLVDDLLDVSRIERGNLAVLRELVDWGSIVRNAAEDNRSNIEARGITLHVEVPGTPVLVRGDPTRLSQILENFLDNARKFSNPGGRIDVTLAGEVDGSHAVLKVRDSGIGMTRDTVARLFRPFEQAEQTSARTLGGLGMGLALVRGLVNLHGGEISASSEGPGRGSELAVRLPVAVEAKREARAAPAERPQLAGLRVLVVEDNADAADTLSLALEMAGCRVWIAPDGRTALELGRAEHPDVVVCDIGLPGDLDGYGVAHLMRSDPALAGTRLVALTGYGQADDRRRAAEAGFDTHVTKPADPPSLLRILATGREAEHEGS